MKYKFIDSYRSEFEVGKMCRALKVSRSGYYAWRNKPVSEREKENEKLVAEIRDIHERSRHTYGSPRVHAELRDRGYRIGRNRVARLMRQHRIRSKVKKRFKVTTHSKHRLAVAANLLKRGDLRVQLFNKLKERGLVDVWLVVSDAHKRLQAVVKKCFLGARWQRCKIHFMRNIMAHVSHHDKAQFAAWLKQIWVQPDRASALKLAELFIEEYEEVYPEAIETLRQGLEDSQQFYSFEDFDSKKFYSTNMQERLHREVRRRSRVVGIFLSEEAYVRLVTSYLIEYSEDLATNRSYICAETIELCRVRLKRVA